MATSVNITFESLVNVLAIFGLLAPFVALRKLCVCVCLECEL